MSIYHKLTSRRKKIPYYICVVIVVLFIFLINSNVSYGKKRKKKKQEETPSDDASNVNTAVKLKRDAKSKARKKFLDKHGIVFDSYGRVLRWGKVVKNYDCKQNKKIGGWYCTVTDSEVRKYLTKEEERRAKMIKLDKQTELDAQYGSNSKDAKRERRLRKENRKRCVMYKDWLTEYKKDDSTDKKPFFSYLSREFVDYQNLRRIQPGSRGVRKSKKIFRNIAREIHSDKLPEGCRSGDFKEMMSTILGKCEKIKDCISEPHTCEEGEL